MYDLPTVCCDTFFWLFALFWQGASSRSSRDRSNDPFIIRSLVRWPCLNSLLMLSLCGGVARVPVSFRCIVVVFASAYEAGCASFASVARLCSFYMLLWWWWLQPTPRQSDASGDVDSIPIGHLPASGVDASIFGDFGADGSKKKKKHKKGDKASGEPAAVASMGRGSTHACGTCISVGLHALVVDSVLSCTPFPSPPACPLIDWVDEEVKPKRVYKVAVEEDEPEGAGASSEEDTAKGREDSLAGIDLTMPLRPDEVMPVPQHRIVKDSKPSKGKSSSSGKGKSGSKEVCVCLRVWCLQRCIRSCPSLALVSAFVMPSLLLT